MNSPNPEVGADAQVPSLLHDRWGTRDRFFPWVAAAFLLVAVAPVWSSRFLPLLDDPNHLSAIYIWKQLADATSPLHEFYDSRFAPVSYVLHYGIAYLLSFVFGVEIAHKLVLSFYVVSFPLAGYLWCRATGRTPWLSLTTIPLAYSITWSYGFHSFNAGLAACLFGVVAQDALLRQTNWRRALWVAGLGLACYFGHPLPLALFWACSVMLWVVHRPGLRAVLYSLLSMLPSFALYEWESSKADVGAHGMRSMLGPDFPLLDLGVLRGRLVDFADHAANPLAGPNDSRVFLAVLVGAVLLFVVGALRGRGAYRSLMLAGGVFGIYLLLPEHFDAPVYLWIARGRVASLAAFFLLLSPAITDQMRARWLALAVAVVGLAVPVMTARAYHEFDRHMGSFERVLEACPRGEQILTIRIDGSDTPTPGFDQPVYRQLPSWVQVVHGGYNPSEFPRPIPFPFFMKKSLPQPHWRGHDNYMPLLQPAVFGCVLTMDLPQRLPENLYKLAREDGNFALYCAVDERGVSRCASK